MGRHFKGLWCEVSTLYFFKTSLLPLFRITLRPLPPVFSPSCPLFWGHTNRLIGPHRALTDLIGPYRTSLDYSPHRTLSEPCGGAMGRGAFRAIALRCRSNPPLKIWSTHMPVPSHLMTGGGSFFSDCGPFPVPSSLPFFYLPHPFSPPLDCLHFPSPPLSFPPFFPFFPRASEFLDEAYPAKKQKTGGMWLL